VKTLAIALSLLARVQTQLKIDVNLRQTIVTVRDRSGQIATGLTAELRGKCTLGYYPPASRISTPPRVRIRAKATEYPVRLRRDPMEIP
jgi:hypothetical protein